MSLFLLGLSAVLAGGAVALFPGLPKRARPLAAPLAMAAGCAVALAGTLGCFTAVPKSEVRIPWNVPGAEAILGLDSLSALFLCLHFLVAGSSVLFGVSYFREERERGLPLPWVHFFTGVLIVSMAVAFAARHAVLFLAAWEIMAVSAFFLIAREHHEPQVRRAGVLYLVASHTGTLCLLAAFVLLGTRAGGYRFETMAGSDAIPSVGPAVFLLALAGFGLKAGFVPLHIWLPEAHPAAPSPVSALLSGVVIKTGVYGLLRVMSFFAAPPAWWGLALLVIGISSGIYGVLWALAQHDGKRLLAYHSVENIGIIAIGLGLGFLGRSLGNPQAALLGFSGGLMHVFNHGLFKSLLFLGAGSVQRATGVRELDQLGGLAKRMPLTALFVLTGSAAISGLPPLNGFVSEWLIFSGAFHLGNAGIRHYFLLVAPALALIGALALACFTKAFSIQFLGAPRSEAASRAREADLWMTGPMAVLAAACVLIGLLPGLFFPAVARAAGLLLGPPAGGAAAQGAVALLKNISWSSAALLAAALSLAALRRGLLRRAPVGESVTWGCGYAEASARMQYTASSFAAFATSLFQRLLRTAKRFDAPAGYFPGASHFSSHTPDAVLDRLLKGALRAARSRLSRVRSLQQGHVQFYLVYILLFLLVLLLWQFHGFSALGRNLLLLQPPQAVSG